MSDDLPVIAGTLQTDPRSGGLKRSSGVNVLPIVAETWAEVRDDANKEVDWLIAGYEGKSKTDITVLTKGSGGIDACARSLPEAVAVFGGCRLQSNGRFVTFYYADEGAPTMMKGRASMHKNGVLNVLEGSDGEIEMSRGLTEDETDLPVSAGGNAPKNKQASSSSSTPKPRPAMAVPKPTPEPVAPVPVVVPAATAESSESSAVGMTIDSSSVATVMYEQLRGITDVAQLPPGVDPLNREQSLSDEEFATVFGMDKESFGKLAAWKRANLKKAKGLF